MIYPWFAKKLSMEYLDEETPILYKENLALRSRIKTFLCSNCSCQAHAWAPSVSVLSHEGMKGCAPMNTLPLIPDPSERLEKWQRVITDLSVQYFKEPAAVTAASS